MIVAEDASWVLLKFAQMEKLKERLSIKGVTERLTLGITRVLGMYHVQRARRQMYVSFGWK